MFDERQQVIFHKLIFCKWAQIVMSTRLPNDAGVARIQKAVANNSIGLSIGQPVLYDNDYYKSYKPTSLPKVKSRNDFHSTFLLDASKQQYINFSLRAGILALQKSASEKPTCTTKFVTIQLNKETSEMIANSVPSRSPTVYCNSRLRRLFFSKLGVTEYFFVIEKSTGGRLHIHLVGNFLGGSEIKFKEMLRKSGWLSFNKHGAISNSSVVITDSYNLKLYFDGTCKDQINRLNEDIERADYDSLWRLSGHIPLSSKNKSKKEWYIYTTVDRIGIDVGLADYLSKSLTDKLFATGNWNYSISRSLNMKMKPFRDQLLLEGKT